MGADDEDPEVESSEGERQEPQTQAEKEDWGNLEVGNAMLRGDFDAFIFNFCKNACASKWLETGVILAILVNGVTLAIQNPATTWTNETLAILMMFDIVLTSIFTVEMFIRIIAMGFYTNPKNCRHPPETYLNDPWNRLDFFVVLSSWLNLFVEFTGVDIGIDVSVLRALRILRILRSLRFFAGIRVILSTIAQAMPYSYNVLAFIGFLLVVAGIIGVQMFRGLGRNKCVYDGFDLQVQLEPWRVMVVNNTTRPAGISDAAYAAGTPNPLNLHTRGVDPPATFEYPIGIGVWSTYCTVNEDCPLFDAKDQWNRTQFCRPALNPGKGFHNFDNIVEAWLALIINMAQLYWWETAHRLIDANNGLGSIIAWGYGAFNVLFLSYISVNMFVAVVTTVFMDVRSAERPEGGMHGGGEEEEEETPREWSKPCYYVPYFGGEGPYIEAMKEPEERTGLIWEPRYHFDQIILFFIIVNTVCLALEHHDYDECTTPQPSALCQHESYIGVMGILELIFNFVFTCEAIIKISGMGFMAYIREHFNKLDFFIVITSGLDMISELMPKDDKGGSMGIFKLFRVFRLFRVLRAARILYRNENLRRVIQTVLGSGDALLNVWLFILFSILLVAILGMHLFGGKYVGDWGDNSGTLWGRVMGNGEYYHRQEGEKVIQGYDIQEFILKGLIPRRSFEDFPRGFLLSFQILTGDDWVNQMHDYMLVTESSAPCFLFIANFAFGNFVLLSLFIAVILENFEVAEAEKMELQKKQREDAEVAEELDRLKPKVTFVHRLTWLLGGEGAEPGFGWGFSDPPDVDPLDGRFNAGEKWYNDDKALFCMSIESPIRRTCNQLATNPIFDMMILICILAGSGMLAYEGPPGSLDPDIAVVFDWISLVFYLVFLVEFSVKVIGYGFMFTPDAYIKDPWNKLDFIVILGSTANYIGANVGIVSLLRCLRPLRIINRNAGMKVIISAVVNSLAVNIGVMALASLGFLIFGILGVNLFAGQFWSCNCSHVYPEGVTPTNVTFNDRGGWTLRNGTFVAGPPSFVNTKQHCVGPDGAGGRFGLDAAFPNAVSGCFWDNRPYNFDNSVNAMMALFTASTLAGWTDIMEIAMDSRGIDMQPIPFSAWYFCVYFIFYVFIMAFFLTNLFVGVLIDFISHQDGSALLTEEQQKLQDTNKFTGMHRPVLREVAPELCIRRWFWGLAESSFWDNLSNGIILFNVAVMMCEYQDQTKAEADLGEWLNYICLLFFSGECVLKVIAYLPVKYWADPWSKFDLTVVLLSWLAIVLDLGSVQAIRALRAFRIILVLKNAKGIRSLFQTLMLSIAPATNISVLLALLYALYGILGMQIFGSAVLQDTYCNVHDNVLHTGPLDERYYCKVGLDNMAQKSYGSQSGGAPGQMLIGLNRQYTHHASFQSFFSAMCLLWQCATGQDWKFVMYAVGGEPGNPDGFPGLAFVYFASFFFLSNYILLNLFVAVILDNFATSMREQELDMTEDDFNNFKWTFREHTTDEDPENISYPNFFRILGVLGNMASTDEDGVYTHNPVSPQPIRPWTEEQETTWRLCTRGLAADAVMDSAAIKECVKDCYNMGSSGGSPLHTDDQPADTYEDYWAYMMKVPATFEFLDDRSAEDKEYADPDHTIDAEWEEWRATGGEGDLKLSVLKKGLQSLAFRENVYHLLEELEFHGVYYMGLTGAGDEASRVNYDKLLQALVNVQMGVEAMTLEQQIEREHAHDVALAAKAAKAAGEQDGGENPMFESEEDGADGGDGTAGLEEGKSAFT